MAKALAGESRVGTYEVAFEAHSPAQYAVQLQPVPGHGEGICARALLARRTVHRMRSMMAVGVKAAHPQGRKQTNLIRQDKRPR